MTMMESPPPVNPILSLYCDSKQSASGGAPQDGKEPEKSLSGGTFIQKISGALPANRPMLAVQLDCLPNFFAIM